ncbi:MAG TPA: VOC family protein [Cyclobacteriaceae bacterium]
MKKTLNPFHLAIPVNEIKDARYFYREVLGFEEGRSSENWVDFNCYGHQLVIHKTKENQDHKSNPVDGHEVPVPHFGVVLEWDVWEELSQKLKSRGIAFIIEPYIRFKGQPGEQATMFFKDPSGNALEFKSFKDMNQLFAK